MKALRVLFMAVTILMLTSCLGPSEPPKVDISTVPDVWNVRSLDDVIDVSFKITGFGNFRYAVFIDDKLVEDDNIDVSEEAVVNLKIIPSKVGMKFGYITFKVRVSDRAGNVDEDSKEILLNMIPYVELIEPAYGETLGDYLEWKVNDENDSNFTFDVYVEKAEAGTCPDSWTKLDNASGIPGGERTQVSSEVLFYKFKTSDDVCWKVVAHDGKTSGESLPSIFKIPDVPPILNVTGGEDGSENARLTQVLTIKAKDYFNDRLTVRVVAKEKSSGANAFEETLSGEGKIEKTVKIPLKPSNSYSIEVSLEDENGNSSEPRRINLKTTDPPNVRLIEPINGVEVKTDEIILKWEGEDPNNDPVKYDIEIKQTGSDWEKIARGIKDTNYNATGKIKAHATVYWKVIAYDDKGASCTSEVASFTTPNSNPVIKKLEASEYENVRVDEPLLITVEAEDPDNDPLTGELKITYSGGIYKKFQLEGTGKIESTEKVMLMSDYTYTIEVVVSDGDLEAKKSINVSATKSPRIDLISPQEGEELKDGYLRWQGSDPDGDPITYKIYLRSDMDENYKDWKRLASLNTGEYYIGDIVKEHCKYYWKVRVEDNKGAYEEEKSWFHTGNSEPVIDEFIDDMTNVRVDKDITINIKAHDDDNDDLIATLTILKNGEKYKVFPIPSTGRIDTFRSIYDPEPDTIYNVKLELTDGFVKLERSANITTTRRPKISLQYPKNGVVVSDGDSFTWDGYDPDGDSISYDLYIRKEGQDWQVLERDLLSKSYPIPLSTLDASSTYYWKVIVKDDKGATNESEEESFKTP